MRARQDLIEIFSSFLQFEADRYRGWLQDPRLRRSMQRRYDQSDATEVRFWAMFWHKSWQQAPQGLAQDHLLAYLQEVCYWVAYKAGTSFTSSQYGVADCFQLAIAHLDKVLKGFDSDQGYDLKNYASAAFSSLIRDQLRQRQEVDICTDWSLLRKVSQKRLLAALQEQGLADSTQAQYRLAWSAYQLIYQPSQASGSRRLTAPPAAAWQAMADYYNDERAAQLNPKSPAVTAQQIETWMGQTARAVRSYLYPASVSMNVSRSDESGGEFLDSFADQGSPMAELLDQESQALRRTQQAQLSSVLQQAIAELEAEAQQLLKLYYSGSVTQQEIASQLNLKQYAISRRLSRLKKALLQKLTTWGQQELHITPAPDIVKHTSAALEEWLKTHYSPTAQPSP